jgi:hypothetical protein
LIVVSSFAHIGGFVVVLRAVRGWRKGLDAGDIVREVSKNAVVKIDCDELAVVLENAEVIRAEDTALAGWIRILSLDGQIVVQEETPEHDVLVRKLVSIDAAHEFVDRRLADYERMWDGCGCKIDYFAPATSRITILSDKTRA